MVKGRRPAGGWSRRATAATGIQPVLTRDLPFQQWLWMSFESLSARIELHIPDFPPEWLPLTYLYDPDLPLFPVLYFHALDPALAPGQRPTFRDRVYGFVQYLNLTPNGAVAGIVLNKDLGRRENAHYEPLVRDLVRERLGLNQRITISDLKGCLGGALTPANQVIEELWHQIIAPAFGNALPFGRCWDGVFGLVRYIASWNSDGGRKGELIQTHYFATAFGERIATGNSINVDFYLLPTFEELQDRSNPLSLFPRFSDLVRAAEGFGSKYCDDIEFDGLKFSAFRMARTGVGRKLKTESVLAIIDAERDPTRRALFENYNAFNRGPHRSIISLMMIRDLRRKGWEPSALSPSTCAKMYFELEGSYQTSKVIQLFAQQCFGAKSALPIDIWVETFLNWPLGFKLSNRPSYATLFASCDVLGKLERLIWVASQGRKVHSSRCAEILWCVRYGGPDKQLRGANPLSCKICLPQIRGACPAYAAIADKQVAFNTAAPPAGFSIETSAGNETTANQRFVSVTGDGIYDEYSSRDRPTGYLPYPQNHGSGALTVADFLTGY